MPAGLGPRGAAPRGPRDRPMREPAAHPGSRWGPTHPPAGRSGATPRGRGRGRPTRRRRGGSRPVPPMETFRDFADERAVVTAIAVQDLAAMADRREEEMTRASAGLERFGAVRLGHRASTLDSPIHLRVMVPTDPIDGDDAALSVSGGRVHAMPVWGTAHIRPPRGGEEEDGAAGSSPGPRSTEWRPSRSRGRCPKRWPPTAGPISCGRSRRRRRSLVARPGG